MSPKHVGSAVLVAGLLMTSPIALGGVEGESHTRTEISGPGEWDHFRAPIWALVVYSDELAGDNGDEARNTRSSSPENDPIYAIIPPTTRSSTISDSPAMDPFQTTHDPDNSNKIVTFAKRSAHPSFSMPTESSRVLTSVSHAKPRLLPTGCARCIGLVARASTGRSTFASVFPWNIFRKGGFRTRHSMAGIALQRNPPLLTALTIPRGWRNPSL
jgi:hypothetical protein